MTFLALIVKNFYKNCRSLTIPKNFPQEKKLSSSPFKRTNFKFNYTNDYVCYWLESSILLKNTLYDDKIDNNIDDKKNVDKVQQLF